MKKNILIMISIFVLTSISAIILLRKSKDRIICDSQQIFTDKDETISDSQIVCNFDI